MKRAYLAWAALGAATALACGDTDTETGFRQVEALEQVGWGMNASAVPGEELFWVAGGSPQRGTLTREDASGQFTQVDTPRVPLLNWLHFFEGGDGFAVGNGGTVLAKQGDTWTLQPTPNEEDLWGVWGATPDDVWAVGGAGRSAGQATLLHFDGDSWSEQALPDLERPNVWALFKVWGSARDDVWVVGQHGVLLHFDGDGWSEHGAGTAEDLISLWGSGPDRIVAVGGRSSAVVARFDGERWRSESLAPLPALNGVWTDDGDTFYVAGIEGTLATLDFDSLELVEDYQATGDAFHSVFGVDGRVLAVGGNLDATAGPYRGLARERSVK